MNKNIKLESPQYDVREIGITDKTGTFVTFQPDASIFEETVYKYDVLVARLRELAYLEQGYKSCRLQIKGGQDEDGEFVKETVLFGGED